MFLLFYLVVLMRSEGGDRPTRMTTSCLHKCSEFLMTPTLNRRHADWLGHVAVGQLPGNIRMAIVLCFESVLRPSQRNILNE